MVARPGLKAVAPAAMVLATLAASVHGRNTIDYQINITDMSPIINYNNPSGQMWTATFSGSPISSHKPGDPGVGESVHSGVLNATRRLLVDFRGQAKSVTVLGDKGGGAPPNGSLSWSAPMIGQTGGTVPGSGSDIAPDTTGGLKNQPGQLGVVANLPYADISGLQLSINDATSGVYNIRGAEIVAPFESEARTIDEVPVTNVFFVVDGALNSMFQPFSGNGASTTQPNWQVTSTDVYIDGVEQQIQEISGDTDSGLSVAVPDNTAFVLINGTTGASRGSASVTFSPQLPIGSNTMDWNASSPYTVATTLYYQAIDPDTRYQLAITAGSLNDASTVRLHSIRFFSGNMPKNTSPSGDDGGGSQIPLIVGVVVGVGGGLILAVVAFYFCIWRPRRKRERREEEERAAINAGFVPFGTGHQSIVQEVDAGTAPLPPPSYDPQWQPGGGLTLEGQPQGGPTTRGPVTGSGLNEKETTSPVGNSPKTPVADWKIPTLAGAYSDNSNVEAVPLSAAPLSAYPRGSPISPLADYKAPLLNPDGRNQATLPPGAAEAHSAPPLSPLPGGASTDQLLPRTPASESQGPHLSD